MTTPSYTEDLTDIATGDEASGWVEFTGNSYNSQGAPAYQDNEYPYIQGSYAVTQDTTKTGVGSLGYNSGGITVPTDGAVFVWHNYSSPFAFGTYAQGGFRIVIGSGLADFKAWYTGGNNKDSYPYGGFVNHVVNPTISADDTAGSPTATLNYVGSAVNVLSGPGKGEPHQVDAMRYGRGSAIFEFGETADYATINGFALVNDNQSYRWGLIQAQPGGYLWKGRMQLGSASNAVDFRDTNKTIFVQWTPKVTINFNLIEIINASSYVSMDGFTIQCLDTTTASPGRFLMTDTATVYLISCSFIDLDTFIFNDGGTNPVEITGCIFRRCGQVTQGGADFDGCNFINCTDGISLVVNNPDVVTDCSFQSDGSNHAIELTAACAGNSYTLTDFWVNGYAASDGSTGNEVILNSSGGTVTLNIDGGSGVSAISVMGGNVTLVANYSFTVTGLELNTEVTIVTAGTSTVLHNTENATTSDGDGKYKITYSHGGGASVDILIHHVDYKPDISNIYSLTLPGSNSSAKVTMFFDENYDNPI